MKKDDDLQAIVETEDSEQSSTRERDTKPPVRHWQAFTLGLVFVGVMTVAFVSMAWFGDATEEAPEVMTAEIIPSEETVNSMTKVQRRIHYEKCGHTVEDELQNSSRYVDKTMSELEADGWQVEKLGAGQIRISQSRAAFCDEDSAKRTIRRTAEGIGVYEGPKQFTGDLIYEMKLDTSQLPEEWQTVLGNVDGNIAGQGIEFASETELMETLENLDEYVIYEIEDEYDSII